MFLFQDYVYSNDIAGFILAVKKHIEDSPNKHPMYLGSEQILGSAAAFFLLDSVYSEHHHELVDLLVNSLQSGQLVARTEKPYEDGFAFLRTLAFTTNNQAFEALYPVAEQVLNTVVSEKHSTMFEEIRTQLAQRQHERIHGALNTNVDTNVEEAATKRKM